MVIFDEQHKAAFQRQGFIKLDQAVPLDSLTALRAEFDHWVEQSRRHSVPYGQMMDGRTPAF